MIALHIILERLKYAYRYTTFYWSTFILLDTQVNCKAFITLSKIKELRYKEVGEIIGCTEGAARTKVHRALNDLKQIYLTIEKE